MTRHLSWLASVLMILLPGTPATANVGLSPIYANEASNWPLETFAANGLFRQIARYQRGHPQAVVIASGHYTLERLASQLDERALSRSGTQWTLHFPLVIAPGAQLTLDGARLYIDGENGGCLVNRGTLIISHSQIDSSGNQYSGFIHGWGGSRTQIDRSTLTGLGRPDYRAHGLSVARHRYQGTSGAPSLSIQQSEFVNLYRGLEAEPGSHVTLTEVTISQSREQGLVLSGAHAQLTQLRIDGSNGHGIRAEGEGKLTLEELVLSTNKGAGLLIENFHGPLQGRNLASEGNREYGIQIKGGRDASAHLEELVLINNGSDGLRLDGSTLLTVSDAKINGNHRYGISLDGQQDKVRTSLTALELHHNRLAALHTLGEGHVQIEGTSLRHHSNRGQYLAGNISARESRLLPQLLQARPVDIPFTDAQPRAQLASRP
ncbi:hypothetical protein Q670_04990 [Alcanivorax sp. P2S70]|uniref:right-handed parallel beta-helix repeat-containing protein n=1 Tax=Alcanivorax TaxID=59753 RepID=UPI0003B48106|nr:right-handed parallel beta-helix repeat-containing protein [Alcanivorax sp. P2S70]ERP86930.1 hypothetical protein Q670_04990 [Alcanivorax sp. P2S70]|tara:strand:+ start:1038 stop:2339 length:1302 start_codon:yes stop_codon:yes gene_type:complete